MEKNKKKRYSAAPKRGMHTASRNLVEDTTEYGEFICSYDNWLPLEEQKKNAEYMENLGD